MALSAKKLSPNLSPRDLAVAIIAIILTIAALRYAAEVILPIALSALVSFSLTPIVNALQRYHLPRFIGATLVTLALLAALVGLAYSLRGEVNDLIDKIPTAVQKAKQRLRAQGNDGAVGRIQRAAGEIQRATNEPLTPNAPAPKPAPAVQPNSLGNYLWLGTKNTASLVGQIAIVFFLIYFFLSYGDLYKRKLIHIAGPSLQRRRVTLEIIDEIHQQIERFLFAQLIGGIVIAVALWLTYWWIGLQNAAAWGVISGVLKLLPYLGPVISTAAVTLAAFVQFDDGSQAVLVAVVTLIITNLEGNLLLPWLTGKMMHMNGAAIFVSLLFWGWVWGAWGVLLAVPIMMIVKVVCDRVDSLKPLGELLGA